MKHSILVTILSASAFSFGQSLTQANEPAIGETQMMYLCDSFATTYESTTGSGVIWDYSNLLGYFGQNKVLSVIDATMAPNAPDFPSSVKAIQIENAFTTYFNSTSTERISQGFVFKEPSLGEVTAIFSTDEEVIATYPFASGSSASDTYEGTLSYILASNTPMTGSAEASVDGQGTLKMPGSNDFTNVIRYKLVDTASFTDILFGDLEITRIQYEYYDINNATLPKLIIMQIVVLQVQPGGGSNSITDQTIVLSAVQPTAYVSLDETQTVTFSVAPNPATDQITLHGEFAPGATAHLTDQSGRTLKSVSIANGTQIDLSDVLSGIYFISVTNNGVTSAKQIVKK